MPYGMAATPDFKHEVNMMMSTNYRGKLDVKSLVSLFLVLSIEYSEPMFEKLVHLVAMAWPENAPLSRDKFVWRKHLAMANVLDQKSGHFTPEQLCLLRWQLTGEGVQLRLRQSNANLSVILPTWLLHNQSIRIHLVRLHVCFPLRLIRTMSCKLIITLNPVLCCCFCG